jgi:hypothetical protein
MIPTQLLLATLLLVTVPAKAADWPTFGHDPQRTLARPLRERNERLYPLAAAAFEQFLPR